VLEIGDGVTVLDAGTGGPRRLQRHERAGPWTLMAHFAPADGKPVAVFEDIGDRAGPIVYVSTDGVLLELAKTLVPTRVAEETCYGGHGKDGVLSAGRDVLREELLARPGDPTAEAVSELFPPIRRVRYGPFEAPHAFVGSPDCIDVVPLYYDSLHATPRVNPLVVAPEIREAIEHERLWEGLVGGWLPAVRTAYPVSERLVWDSLAFAVVDPPTSYQQPVWYRFLKLEDGELLEARYVDSYLPYPWPDEPPAERFYTDLRALHGFWRERLAGAMELELPEAWIADFCRHSLVLEMITRIGDHPRYGVVDRAYGGAEHDGFQDVLTSAVGCYLEWGLHDVARRYLHDYLSHFVCEDGPIAYRGPEIGQYGRMLTLLAQHYDTTGDDSLLVAHGGKIAAIVRILLTRRARATERAVDDPAFGLIAGRHEADISFDTPTLATLDYEQPYFSNSTEAWRGLRDLGRAWSELGERRHDVELLARGRALVDEAAALALDVERAIERSWIERDGVRTLPLIGGSQLLHVDAPYRSRPESFDESRVWSEMLHSGIVRRETVEAILASASTRGDTTLGIFGNRTHVVAFGAYGEAYGLVQHDLVRELLLLYYAHASHLHTRGTWTALECVDMDRDRAEHLPYCAPAQLTIPTVTKWMLVFEDPLDETLWLAKATPRRWLADGERIRVAGAPTRSGAVSYEIRSQIERGRVAATVELPDGRQAEAKLRLRVPEPHVMRRVEVNGRPWPAFDPSEETVTLPADLAGWVELTVSY
jgi:hypothetical protein